jgi:hypothetical protein
MKIHKRPSARHALKTLVELRQKRPGGTLKGDEIFLKNDYKSVLHTCLRFDSQISGADKSRIIDKTINDCAENNIKDLDEFSKKINMEERAYLQYHRQNYYFVTSISIKVSGVPTVFRRYLKNSTITISRNKPGFLGPCKWFLNGFGQIDSLSPRQYACVYAKTQARTKHEAAEKARHDIDLTLALLNYTVNILNRPIFEQEFREPINKIRTGPHQTLHDHQGKPYKDIVWYEIESDFSHTPLVFDLSSEKNGGAFDSLVGRLNHHKFRNLIERALLSYNAALNYKDRNLIITKLWQALEILTIASATDSVIHRATMFSKEPKMRKLFLENAQHVRNVVVHEGSTHEFASDIVSNLRNYIESIIELYLFGNVPAKNEKELFQLLKGPHTAREIDDEIARLRKVQKLVPK